MVECDTNNEPDVFVYDLRFNTIDRVSVKTNCDQYENSSYQGTYPTYITRIDSNGRYVSFVSPATDLVAEANPDRLYLHDAKTGKTTSLTDGEGTAITANRIIDGRTHAIRVQITAVFVALMVMVMAGVGMVQVHAE